MSKTMSEVGARSRATGVRRAIRRSASWERLGYGTVGIVVLLLLWQVLSDLEVLNPLLVSSPTKVAEAGWALVSSGEIWQHIASSIAAWTLGFVTAAVVGILVGLISGWYRRVRYVADVWLNALDSVPSLALVPIFIIWFGIDLTFQVFLVFISCVFYIAVNTLSGVKSTEARYLDVATSYGARQSKVFRSVVLPACVPYIMTGLRQASAKGIVGIVVAEFVASNRGIGFLIITSGSTFNTARLMFAIALLSLFGIIVNEVLQYVEGRFDAWRK